MSKHAVCPDCNSSNIILIGAFFLSHEGVAVIPNVTLDHLASSGYSLTRMLVQCGSCGKRATLEDAQKAAGLESKTSFWDTNDKGLSRPIVCPKCGNNEQFTREVVYLTKGTEFVTINDGKLDVVESSDSQEQDQAVLKYVCALDGCTGEINLRPDTYGLVARND